MGATLARTQEEPRQAGAGRAERRATLDMLDGTRRRFTVGPGRFSVGSGTENDLVIADPFVSKRHCSLSWKGAQLWLRDEGSKNGTWVNRMRVESCALRGAARIHLGRTKLRLLFGGHDGQLGDGMAHGMIGRSSAMQRVFRLIDRFGAAGHPTLVLGETGTGKELVARALHHASPCDGGPFEAINCAAIPAELAESELFGHRRGAFTGAVGDHQGAFQRADGGTLFLDEIGEMPMSLQAKLLRVLEEGVVRPVGCSEARHVEVRLIAATHRPLDEEAHAGRFRLDLFYRLAVAVIDLPPLDERREDIPLLLTHFIEMESRRAGVALDIADTVAPLLERLCWPGNVRALRHAVARAAALCEEGVLEPRHFAFLEPRRLRGRPSAGNLQVVGKTFKQLRQEIYREVIRAHGGNRSAAAATLGIPKSTFFDHLRAMLPDD